MRVCAQHACVFANTKCIHLENNGFTCNECTKLRRKIRNVSTSSELRRAQEVLRVHLQTVFAARKVLADYKVRADRDEGYMLLMADAADQAKHGSPSIRQGGRAGTQVKKIKQQFIGVIIYNRGYRLYRRLPVTPKGANLTCTIIMDLITKGLMKKTHTLVVQWDGG